MSVIEVCAKTDIGRMRSVNEDSVLDTRLGQVHVLVVADGLGGHAAGEVASTVAVREIEKSLKTHLAEGDLLATLQRAVAEANREVYTLSKANPAYAGMGTTLVAALVFESKALIGNVGDSRAYLVGDAIEQITKDHSLVQELVDMGLITEEEAFDHPQKNIVTMTLGLEDEAYPDFYEVDLAGKTLLLCSDGLSDYVRDEEIFKTVVASRDLEETCSRLISLANAKGGADNITVVLARAAA